MQTVVVADVTDVIPSPVVDTVGVKLEPSMPPPGRFEIDGVEGVARPTS